MHMFCSGGTLIDRHRPGGGRAAAVSVASADQSVLECVVSADQSVLTLGSEGVGEVAPVGVRGQLGQRLGSPRGSLQVSQPQLGQPLQVLAPHSRVTDVVGTTPAQRLLTGRGHRARQYTAAHNNIQGCSQKN